MAWKYLSTGKRPAAENMALDSALLSDLQSERDPILHLYDWEGESATYGYFINPDKFFNSEGIAKHGLHLAKRPTGGGIVFHNCDLAFSVLMPASHGCFSFNTLDNYAFVNNRVIWVVQKVMKQSVQLLPQETEMLEGACRSFCMAKPTKYDVMIQGKKVCGAAMRKTRHGFLYQGSIFIGFLPDSYLLDVLGSKREVIEKMRQNSLAILGENWTKQSLEEMRDHLKGLLQQAFSEQFEGEFR